MNIRRQYPLNLPSLEIDLAGGLLRSTTGHGENRRKHEAHACVEGAHDCNFFLRRNFARKGANSLCFSKFYPQYRLKWLEL